MRGLSLGTFFIGLFWDHTEYMVPRSFMCVPERFVSHGPTPAGWPKGGRSHPLAGLV